MKNLFNDNNNNNNNNSSSIIIILILSIMMMVIGFVSSSPIPIVIPTTTTTTTTGTTRITSRSGTTSTSSLKNRNGLINTVGRTNKNMNMNMNNNGNNKQQQQQQQQQQSISVEKVKNSRIISSHNKNSLPFQSNNYNRMGNNNRMNNKNKNKNYDAFSSSSLFSKTNTKKSNNYHHNDLDIMIIPSTAINNNININNMNMNNNDMNMNNNDHEKKIMIQEEDYNMLLTTGTHNQNHQNHQKNNNNNNDDISSSSSSSSSLILFVVLAALFSSVYTTRRFLQRKRHNKNNNYNKNISNIHDGNNHHTLSLLTGEGKGTTGKGTIGKILQEPLLLPTFFLHPQSLKQKQRQRQKQSMSSMNQHQYQHQYQHQKRGRGHTLVVTATTSSGSRMGDNDSSHWNYVEEGGGKEEIEEIEEIEEEKMEKVNVVSVEKKKKKKDDDDDDDDVIIEGKDIDETLLSDDEFGEHGAAFLSGNFAPIRTEHTVYYSTTTNNNTNKNKNRIIGEIPHDFPKGQFAYIGPNPKFDPEHYKLWGNGPQQDDFQVGDSFHHWFEGDGMVYVLDFLSQKKNHHHHHNNDNNNNNNNNNNIQNDNLYLCYRNRYIRTKSWKDEVQAGARKFRPLMNAEGKTFLLNALANLFQGGAFLKDSANTAIIHYAGKTLALQDTMPPYELDPHDLTTKGACDFDGQLSMNTPFTAHPKVCPRSKDLVFFGFNPVLPPHISLGTLNEKGIMTSQTPLWSFPFAGCTFMHDFCITENYTVLFEGSMDIKPVRQVLGEHPLQYNRSKMARFGVLKRTVCEEEEEEEEEQEEEEERGGSDNTTTTTTTKQPHSTITWYDCNSSEMVYHFINSWEEINDKNEEEIVILGVREDGFFHSALKAKGTREWITKTVNENIELPRVHEWRINITNGEISEKYLFDDVVEIPRINDLYTGIKNRYSYAGRIRIDSLQEAAQLKFDALIKFDVKTMQKQIYEHGPGRYGMEAQFVPHPNPNAEEDDGWLIMYVHDENNKEQSECIILDAKNISNGPVAQIMLPDRIPYGAHAMWKPEVIQEMVEKKNTEREEAGVESMSNDNNDITTTKGDTKFVSRREPTKFTFLPNQVNDLLGAVQVGILRAGSGLFVNGWRPWIRREDSEKYSFIGFGGFELSESCNLGSFRQEQAQREAVKNIQESPNLILYDIESNSDCRRVREALSMLDMAFENRPCPYGANKHRLMAADTQGVSLGSEVYPLLIDSESGMTLLGADDIITYLYDIYLDGSAPSPLVANTGTSNIAVKVRNKPIYHTKPYQYPDQPLVLWGYEASPFVSLVREKLCEMEIPYIFRPCSRGSPRRTELLKKANTFQVPYLEDPNTETCLFESAEIIEYLLYVYTFDRHLL